MVTKMIVHTILCTNDCTKSGSEKIEAKLRIPTNRGTSKPLHSKKAKATVAMEGTKMMAKLMISAGPMKIKTIKPFLFFFLIE